MGVITSYTREGVDPLWLEHGPGIYFQSFQNLMRRRIRDVLLVASPYDLYIFEEDGRLYDLIRNEYQGWHLSHSPELTRVSSGHEAITLAKDQVPFDLIITTPHVEDMVALTLARKLRESGLHTPVVLLATDDRELKDLLTHHDTSVFDRIFIWQGDFRLIIGVIKDMEDRLNVDDDTRSVGVQSIILIEDNIRYYSSFLPLIYSELFIQSQRLLSEGINLSHRYLRMRARPKILLCTTYEEAWAYYEKYQETILGVISDIDFMRGGVPDPRAGIEFAKNVKAQHLDIPIVLQSYTPENEAEAHAIGASFLLKNSPTLLHDIRTFMVQYFSFGDFVFRTPDGKEVGRASDLKSLEEQLHFVPEESIRFHGERNHFSNWLKARTEFWLAQKLRPRKVSDYPDVAALREDLISSLREYQRKRQHGIITDFAKETFDPSYSFARIGGGSLGGKARGLGFVNTLINIHNVRDTFEDVQIYVPAAVVVGTDVFDRFLDENNLRSFALNATDDGEITRRFVESESFPSEIVGQLADFLDLCTEPLAVRSSSLLEDSQYYPFAGVYETYMIPNNHPDQYLRLSDLVTTVKRVYASTFYQTAKEYITATSYRLEEEKMAVVIQKMVGAPHDDRFYPDFSGVGRSYNYYPVSPQQPQDGIVSVALGLGKTIGDGGTTVRFCPKYPSHLPQFSSTEETLQNNQQEFFALQLNGQSPDSSETHDVLLKKHGLGVAERDGTLRYVASTYSPENDTVYDGLSRSGIRVVTFSPILRTKLFPLPEMLELLLDLGSWGMGTPVEIEFAVKMSVATGSPKEFGLLQMRPLVVGGESEFLDVDEADTEKLLCQSHQVLGNGIIGDVYDIVVVDSDRFERTKSLEVAKEINIFNEQLVSARRPYLLIGVGRWGSLDPLLGIPVKWNQISGARAIVEAGFRDLAITPSQGSHFFQNITAFTVGYFTINSKVKKGILDWEWLSQQEATSTMKYTRHLVFERPLLIKMNGRQNKGVILKPESGNQTEHW